MDIATRLDEAMRLRDNISQSALHRLSGVPQPTINRILKGGGAKGPETNTVRKLSEALDVRFEWLMDGKGPMTQEGAEARRPESWSVLTRVDEYELRMLDLVRQLDERGRRDAEESLKVAVETSKKFADPAEVAERDRQRASERGSHLGVVGSTPTKQRKS